MKARLAVLPAVLLALFAGCGGDGDEDPTTPAATTPQTTSLTKQELLEQGDAICAEVNAAVGTVSTGTTETASRVDQEADLYTGMVERLKGLGTPDDTAGYEEFLGAGDALAQAQADASLAAAREDSAALAEAEEDASSALASFRSASQAYGFEECSQGPSAPSATGTGTAVPGAEIEAEEAPEGEEAAPEGAPEAEPEPETGGAGSAEEGGGAEAGGGTAGGGTESGGGGGSSGGIGPG